MNVSPAGNSGYIGSHTCVELPNERNDNLPVQHLKQPVVIVPFVFNPRKLFQKNPRFL